MKQSWTGGQYSVFRALFGIYLAIHFAALVPYGAELFSNQGALGDASASPLIHAFPNVLALVDSPAFVAAFLVSACVASLAFAIGWRDRWMAIFAWYVLACLFGRDPLISNPALPYVGFALIAHAFLPTKPFGAIDARGRIDPNGGWVFPRGIYFAAWVALAVGYGYSGATKLASPSWVDGTAIERVLGNPLARPTFLREWLVTLPSSVLKLSTWSALALELSFPLFALFRRTRPWIWLALLSMHLGLIAIVDFADLSFGMVMIHLLTFDPGWIAGRAAHSIERVYYDGHCGLCHRAVRFLLAEDVDGSRFRFAPLQGDTCAARIASDRRARLPDSVVIETADGRLLVKSAAVLHILARLGGVWRVLGIAGAFFPCAVRDKAYDAVARIRRKLFPPPPDACPLSPPGLRTRFDA